VPGVAVVPLGVLSVLHHARRSDVPGVTRVIGVSSGVVRSRRRVTGVGAVPRGFPGNFRLRVGRRLVISPDVLGIVAHVVNLPHLREYALVQ
jgi:hypothetical protein